MATSRSIRGDGVFDAETFAKIELTVWPSYALGAGIGSREAATNLQRRDVSWATNFFKSDRSVYIDGGGNGAAMRIQPHVWAAGARGGWQTDVIVNSVCTHGHMRGILGALFHAACLDFALKNAEPPGLMELREAAKGLSEAPHLIRSHDLLDHLWLGLWEKQSSQSLDLAVETVVGEINDDLIALEGIGNGVGGYEDAVEALSAYKPDRRGSGTKTALLAAVAARLFRGDPAQAISVCANRLGTDTDSIATMAGALVGATTGEDPDLPLLERAYIAREAERLWAIGDGRVVPSFPYPSIMTWGPPRSQVDCLGISESDEGGMALAGLGPADPRGKIIAGTGKSSGSWGWVELWFGQCVLVKRRPRPKPLPQSQIVKADDRYVTASLLDAPHRAPRSRGSEGGRSREVGGGPPIPPSRLKGGSLHEITDDVIATGFDPETVGQALLDLAERDDGIESVGQYATILAKAILSRRDRERRG